MIKVVFFSARLLDTGFAIKDQINEQYETWREQHPKAEMVSVALHSAGAGDGDFHTIVALTYKEWTHK